MLIFHLQRLRQQSSVDRAISFPPRENIACGHVAFFSYTYIHVSPALTKFHPSKDRERGKKLDDSFKRHELVNRRSLGHYISFDLIFPQVVVFHLPSHRSDKVSDTAEWGDSCVPDPESGCQRRTRLITRERFIAPLRSLVNNFFCCFHISIFPPRQLSSHYLPSPRNSSSIP